MRVLSQLPVDESFQDVDNYIEALFDFVASSELFKALCGGIHILGFFTVEPEIYASTLPSSWRRWFALHDIATILDLLLHEDLKTLELLRSPPADPARSPSSWRGCEAPPESLLDFIFSIRRLSLRRSPEQGSFELDSVRPPHSLVVGMKPKKIHETQHFAKFISDLQAHIVDQHDHKISHIVDFGSGQNYLGRTLASPPHNENIIAIERKQHNIDGAQAMDIHAKLAEKIKIVRNKKAFRQQTRSVQSSQGALGIESLENQDQILVSKHVPGLGDNSGSTIQKPITYVEQNIEDGDLSYLDSLLPMSTLAGSKDAKFLVISLHSCGDLLHHGLRSLTLNKRVKAVAMVGCCYHLNSDRIGPPTWKPPFAHRPPLPDQHEPGNPNGFPLSNHLLTYRHRNGAGIKLNITARMMASQAAANWTDQDCDSFFKRHFYRALLQKVFLDRGVLAWAGDGDYRAQVDTEELRASADLPITIGSLRKPCYSSFTAYVRGAMQKLSQDQSYDNYIKSKMASLTDDEITAYEDQYHARKKQLSVMWTLMAFVAGVTESVILVDRFLYLREQPNMARCWVEPVFNYKQSPRNLVVVGIKK